jgi:hypothetical protein
MAAMAMRLIMHAVTLGSLRYSFLQVEWIRRGAKGISFCDMDGTAIIF